MTGFRTLADNNSHLAHSLIRDKSDFYSCQKDSAQNGPAYVQEIEDVCAAAYE